VAQLAYGADVVVREQRSQDQQTLDTINPGDAIVVGWDEAAPLLLGEASPTLVGDLEES
jgi:hypothetical protein